MLRTSILHSGSALLDARCQDKLESSKRVYTEVIRNMFEGTIDVKTLKMLDDHTQQLIDIERALNQKTLNTDSTKDEKDAHLQVVKIIDWRKKELKTRVNIPI